MNGKNGQNAGDRPAQETADAMQREQLHYIVAIATMLALQVQRASGLPPAERLRLAANAAHDLACYHELEGCEGEQCQRAQEEHLQSALKSLFPFDSGTTPL